MAAQVVRGAAVADEPAQANCSVKAAGVAMGRVRPALRSGPSYWLGIWLGIWLGVRLGAVLARTEPGE